jgi:hypothetical protein
MTNSKRLTGNRSNSSDNDLRPGRQDSCNNGLRANAAAEKPSPTKDENQPFKPKRRRSRGAGGVGGLVGRDNLLRLPRPQRRRPPAHRRRTGVRHSP